MPDELRLCSTCYGRTIYRCARCNHPYCLDCLSQHGNEALCPACLKAALERMQQRAATAPRPLGHVEWLRSQKAVRP